MNARQISFHKIVVNTALDNIAERCAHQTKYSFSKGNIKSIGLFQ